MDKKVIDFKNTNNIVIPIALGVIISLVVSILLVITGTIFLNNEAVGETSLPWIALIIWSMSICIGTIITVFAFNVSNVIIPCVTGILYLIVLLSIKMLFIDTGFIGIGWGTVAVVVAMLPSIFIILQNKPGKRKKYKYRK